MSKNISFYIQVVFIVLGLVLLFLGTYVFPNIKNQQYSNLLSVISLTIGFLILIIIVVINRNVGK